MQEAAAVAFATIEFVVTERVSSYFTPVNFFPCARAIVAFGLSDAVTDKAAVHAVEVLFSLYESLLPTLEAWGRDSNRGRLGGSDETGGGRSADGRNGSGDVDGGVDADGHGHPGEGDAGRGDGVSAHGFVAGAVPEDRRAALVQALGPEKGSSSPAPSADVDRGWSDFAVPLMHSLAELCRSPRTAVRNFALVCMQRVVLGSASLSSEVWRDTFSVIIFPLIEETARAPVAKPAAVPAANAAAAAAAATAASKLPPSGSNQGGAREETLLRASALLSKAFLRCLPALVRLRDFHSLWKEILDKYRLLAQSGEGDFVSEAVLESLKNTLLVMAGSGLFRPENGSAAAATGATTPPTAERDALACYGVELFNMTFKEIDGFAPNLKRDFVAQIRDEGAIPPQQ